MRKWQRWFYAGGQWSKKDKGVYVNLLTWTLDISYGNFGEPKANWSFTFRKMGKW